MRLILAALLTAPLWAATFTSTKTGACNDPTTWGFGAGACVAHSTCPAMTDGGSGGDVWSIGHAITIPAGVTCSAGTSTTGATAISGTGSLSIAGTLIYAGNVTVPPTVQAGGAVQYDSSWSATPTTDGYTWSVSSGSFAMSGTSGSHAAWTGAGNSAANAACNGNACRSGLISIGSAVASTLAYADFSHLGPTSQGSGNQSLQLTLLNADCSWDHVHLDDANSLYISESGSTGTGNCSINALRVTNSVSTNSSYGPVQIKQAASSATNRVIQNSWIQGTSAAQESPVSGNKFRFLNVVYSDLSTLAGVGIQGSASVTNFDQILIHNQSSGDIFAGSYLGSFTNSTMTRYINPSLGFAHSWYPKATVIDGLTTEGNVNVIGSGSWIGPSPNVAMTVRNSVHTCGTGGKIDTPFVVFQSGNTTGVYNFYHNTICSATTNPAHAGAFDAEASTVAAGTFARLDSNIVYRLDSFAGTNPIAGGPNFMLAGAIVNPGWNAVYGNTGANYAGGAAQAGVIATGPTADQNFARAPLFLDSERRLINFDTGYLGDAVSSTVWTAGATYSSGDVVSDHQSTIFGGATYNWRMKSAAGGCNPAGTGNRPLNGTAWVGCWEPAALQRIITLVLAGTQYTDSSIGVSGVGVIGALNAWIRTGYKPTGADATALRTAGFAGSYVGAVAPAPIPRLCGLPNSLVCR